MGAPPIIRSAPDRITTQIEKLEAIATEFRDNLERIRQLATNIQDEVSG